MPRIRANSIAEHKVQTRSAILEAASKLFFDEGFASVTLADIAAECGIGRTTLYQYFSGKEELLLALISDRVPHQVEIMLSELPVDVTPVQWFESLLERSLCYAASHMDMVKVVLLDGSRLGPDARSRLTETTGRIAGTIRDRVTAASADGTVAAADPDGVAEFVQLVLSSALTELLEDDGRDVAAVIETWTPILHAALEPQLVGS